MLILFKPWCSLQDLKDISQTWTDAYYSNVFPLHLSQIIQNINIEHECQDVCDTYQATCSYGGQEPLLDDHAPASALAGMDEESLAMVLMQDSNINNLLIQGDLEGINEDNPLANRPGVTSDDVMAVKKCLAILQYTGVIDSIHDQDCMIDAMAPNATMLGYEERNIMFDTANLCAQCKLMAFFKKTNCPVFFTTIHTPPLGRACLLNLLPSTTIAYLLDA